MKKSSVIVTALAVFSLAVSGAGSAIAAPAAGTITTSQFFSFQAPGGLSHSYTDTHTNTNTNNVTIGWSGGHGAVSIAIKKGSYYCPLGPSSAASASLVCTGVPAGTITVVAVGNSGASATFRDSYSS